MSLPAHRSSALRRARVSFVASFAFGLLLAFTSCARNIPHDPIPPLVPFEQRGDALIARHRFGCGHVLEYGLTPAGKDYAGWLTIHAATGEELWADSWIMDIDDLEELMETEGSLQPAPQANAEPAPEERAADGPLLIEDWVRHAFSGRLHYGIALGEVTLSADDLDEENLASSATYFHISASDLRQMILTQPASPRVGYRATWREDCRDLIFVRSLNHYVRFGNGGY